MIYRVIIAALLVVGAPAYAGSTINDFRAAVSCGRLWHEVDPLGRTCIVVSTPACPLTPEMVSGSGMLDPCAMAVQEPHDPSADLARTWPATTSIGTIDWGKCQEQFAGLPALAERLGVKPGVGIDAGTVMLRMCDGTDYSMFGLINAVLDRIDNATAPVKMTLCAETTAGDRRCPPPNTINGTVVYDSHADNPLRAFLCPDDRTMICVTGVNGLHTEYRFRAE